MVAMFVNASYPNVQADAKRLIDDVFLDTPETREASLRDALALFKSLSPEQAQVLVSHAGEDVLTELAADLNSPAAWRGLLKMPTEFRHEFYGVLAGKLGGLQLADFTRAAADWGEAEAVGQAIGDLPEDQRDQRVFFLGTQLKSVEVPQVERTASFLMVDEKIVDKLPMKTAFARTLSRMEDHPVGFNLVLHRLPASAIDTVLKGGLGVRDTTHQISLPFSTDPIEIEAREFTSHAALDVMNLAIRIGDGPTRCALDRAAGPFVQEARALASTRSDERHVEALAVTALRLRSAVEKENMLCTFDASGKVIVPRDPAPRP